MRSLALVALLFLEPLSRQTLWEGSEPRPQGKTPQERPQLVWQMQPKGAELRRIQMRVNDKPIPTRYDIESHSIIGEPMESLPLGRCKATCEAWLSNDKAIDIAWEFIRVPAPPTPPPPDAQQQEALQRLNQLRRTVLLPDVTLQPALCLAAARHSRYLLANKLPLTHIQQPGLPEFYGTTPDERAERAGFFEPCYEVVAQSPRSLSSLQNLMDAPYHRAALLQPGAFPTGVGIAGDRITLLCATSNQKDILVYPADGQLDVPVQWKDEESPDPLRLYPGVSRTTGYPLTLHLYGTEDKPELVSASLTGPDETPVPCYTNSPANDDELDDMILLIPQKPLLPMTTYRARIAVRESGGREVVRGWQFTTGRSPLIEPPAPQPKPLLKPPATKPKKKK